MKYAVAVTTAKPSSALTPGGGGGCLTLLDPKTGAVLSSLRSSVDLSGKTSMGISTLSTFPGSFCVLGSNASHTIQPAIAYGGNSAKKGDNYAMLISIRNSTSPPILHWKCRLPETEMSAGLILSCCGHYVVGGGASGSCYIWSSLGGKLLRTFQAHYRACSCLEWSDCGRYLVTGGADGMIHLFSLMDLVDTTSRNAHRSTSPLHTFSIHHFPVTTLTKIPSGRMASTSEDGQVLLVELFSKTVLLNVHLPHGIRSMAYHNGRMFLGSTQGTVYTIDTDAYAMHQTERQGAVFARRRSKAQLDGSARTMDEIVFGRNDRPDDNVASYQMDWLGHDSPVTSIAMLTPCGDQQIMVTGDESGQVRIWDLESRTCLNILHLWSQTAGQSPAASTQQKKVSSGSHPVTSICIISQPNDAASSSMFRSYSSSHRNATSISTLVSPLQKFVEEDVAGASVLPVPFLPTNRNTEELHFWEAQPILRKRRRYQQEEKSTESSGVRKKESDWDGAREKQAMALRIMELEEQLKSKQTEVDRWETVNNKLMAKLQTTK
ncbi:WD40 repeat-containing protein [Nitzschia inconspicua]|uniref:WD40 repeat-containing protein n=1 Tax=Nitzschia inconspicua TaxID=303405 RepID=A0A9K3PJI1_9STRA|nr:WD40 repeat-containing protein [Nitzschia inconspicua]